VQKYLLQPQISAELRRQKSNREGGFSTEIGKRGTVESGHPAESSLHIIAYISELNQY